MAEPQLSLAPHVNSRFLVQLMRASVFILLSHSSQTAQPPAAFSAPALDPEGCLCIPLPGMLVPTPFRALTAFRFPLDFL